MKRVWTVALLAVVAGCVPGVAVWAYRAAGVPFPVVLIGSIAVCFWVGRLAGCVAVGASPGWRVALIRFAAPVVWAAHRLTGQTVSRSFRSFVFAVLILGGSGFALGWIAAAVGVWVARLFGG